MARLRQLRISDNIRKAQARMKELEQEAEALEQRRNSLTLRENELIEAREEVNEDTSVEDRTMLEEQVGQWEQDDETLTHEEAENERQRSELQRQIETLQQELEEINARGTAKSAAPEKKEERKENTTMNYKRNFFGMNHQERDAFFAREDVKGFIARVREYKAQNRTVNNAQLLIPEVMLGIIREQAEEASKLLKHVNVRAVPGRSRVIIAGTIPEAVWTEMCAKLNELTIGFNSLEMDGYKVGGYFAVCNAILADADEVSLATEFITTLGRAIGLALDKAILYGTGTKMPLGIVTRLAQTTQPDNYPSTAREWVDLSDTNLLNIPSGTEGLELFTELALLSTAAKGKHSTGAKFWAMNEATKMKLMVHAASIAASGAIVTGVQNSMPLVGGVIETLEFIPDGVVIGGYGDLYLLAEREGTNYATSEHYLFVEDQTVFKGEARYDGAPAIPEGFVAIAIGSSTAPTASAVTFAPDEAND